MSKDTKVFERYDVGDVVHFNGKDVLIIKHSKIKALNKKHVLITTEITVQEVGTGKIFTAIECDKQSRSGILHVK